MSYSRQPPPPASMACPQPLRPQTQPPVFRASVQPGQYFPQQQPQAQLQQQPRPPSQAQSMASSSLGPPRPSAGRRPSFTTNESSFSSSSTSSSLTGQEGPRLSITLPSVNDLADVYQRAAASGDPTSRVRFAKLLFRHIERTQAAKQDESPSSSSSSIRDQRIVKWVEDAVAWIKRYRDAMPPIPEALYLHGDLAMAGTFPSLVPQNHREAFQDFEKAANAEYAPAWYRIGREYEAFKEYHRARDAYENGRRIGDVTCTYRLGKALLHGELEMQPNPRKAVDYHHTAALISERLAEPETAGPMYIYAMMLAGEFDAPSLTPDILPQNVKEASEWLIKAAYLNHALSQFKCGHAREYALLSLTFDPLLSVEYYYLASLQGNTEACMALSRWFLCGAEDFFEADEQLAYIFAVKATRKKDPLPAAVFALAYYHEVGIANRKDIAKAREGYEKVLTLDDPDAKSRAQERLDALLAGNEALSRAQHMNNIETTLVRKHTQARLRSDETRRQANNGATPRPDSQQVSGQDTFRRRNTVKKIQQATLNQSQSSTNNDPRLLEPGSRMGRSPSPGPGLAPGLVPRASSRASSPSPKMQMQMQMPMPNQSPQMPPQQFHPPVRHPSAPPGPPGQQGYYGPPPQQQLGAPPFGQQQRPISGPARQPSVTAPPHLPRYTLTDSPLPAPSGAPFSDPGYSSQASTPGKRPQSTNASNSNGGSSFVEHTIETKPSKGPETFAQMGIPVEKLSKNDQCTIM